MWNEIHFTLQQGWAWLWYTLMDNPIYGVAVVVFVLFLFLILRSNVNLK